MSNMTDVRLALRQPFDPSELKFRPADKGGSKALAFIDARSVYERLTSVVGIANWQIRTSAIPVTISTIDWIDGKKTPTRFETTAFHAEIGIYFDDLGWIWKSNFADQSDQDALKGGASDAHKRAAVLWGIGAYMYDLKDLVGVWDTNKKIYTTKPTLPEWAKPVDMEIWGRALTVPVTVGNSTKPFSEVIEGGKKALVSALSGVSASAKEYKAGVYLIDHYSHVYP
jgi:hypothetical protein